MIQRSNITSIIEDMQTSGYNSFAYWILKLLEKYCWETIWARGFGWMHLTQSFCDISFCERLVQLRIRFLKMSLNNLIWPDLTAIQSIWHDEAQSDFKYCELDINNFVPSIQNSKNFCNLCPIFSKPKTSLSFTS